MDTPLEKSCCFTGHRKIDLTKIHPLVEKLHLEIDYLVGCGVKHFYAGGALGFDTLAALAVLLHRQKGADIMLHLMLPCPDQTYRWSEKDKAVYEDIKKRADSYTVLSDHYHSGVMQMRNRAMVDRSMYCVCYFDNDNMAGETKGGTLYTVNYARKQKRKLINLWDEPPEDAQIEFDFFTV